jgi:hypothetical protein
METKKQKKTLVAGPQLLRERDNGGSGGRERWWPVISSALFSVRFGSEASECTRLNHCNPKQSKQCDRWIGLIDGLTIQTG